MIVSATDLRAAAFACSAWTPADGCAAIACCSATLSPGLSVLTSSMPIATDSVLITIVNQSVRPATPLRSRPRPRS